MSVNFPSNPSTGTVYISGERAWRWEGVYWKSISTDVGYTGSRGDQGFVGSVGYSGSIGYTGSAGPVATTKVFTATVITLDPTQVPLVTTSTITYGTYITGDIQSINTFGDYASPNGYWAANDSVGIAPGIEVYTTFDNVDKFNKIVGNIRYTQTTSYALELDIYNFNSGLWDNYATLIGLNEYSNLSVGVVSSVPYIWSGTVYTKIHHTEIGYGSHEIRIDFLSLEMAIEGPQGPPGNLGYSGSIGYAGSRGYTGSGGDKSGVKYNFETVTAAFPPSGIIRYNNNFAPVNVSTIYLSSYNSDGVDFSNYISNFTATDIPILGSLSIVDNRNNAATHHIFDLLSVSNNVSFFSLGVAYRSGSTTFFPDTTSVVLQFNKIGPRGFVGYAGSRGAFDAIGFTGSEGTGYSGSQGPPGNSIAILGTTSTFASLPAGYTGAVGDSFIVQATGNLAVWGGSTWTDVGRIIGYTGSAGSPGGYTGSAGYSGSPGTRGYTGSRGVGYTGSPGIGVGLYDKHFNYPGTLGVAVGTARWYSMNIQTISKITAYVTTAPVGGNVGVRVRQNGSVIATLIIPDGSYTVSINTNITTADAEYITVDIFEVGVSVKGSDLVVSFLYTRAGS